MIIARRGLEVKVIGEGQGHGSGNSVGPTLIEGSFFLVALSSENDRNMATDSMYRKFREVWMDRRVVSEIRELTDFSGPIGDAITKYCSLNWYRYVS